MLVRLPIDLWPSEIKLEVEFLAKLIRENTDWKGVQLTFNPSGLVTIDYVVD